MKKRYSVNFTIKKYRKKWVEWISSTVSEILGSSSRAVLVFHMQNPNQSIDSCKRLSFIEETVSFTNSLIWCFANIMLNALQLLLWSEIAASILQSDTFWLQINVKMGEIGHYCFENHNCIPKIGIFFLNVP